MLKRTKDLSRRVTEKAARAVLAGFLGALMGAGARR
jgi:hypothetical protein